jgi:hypothetical protein
MNSTVAVISSGIYMIYKASSVYFLLLLNIRLHSNRVIYMSGSSVGSIQYVYASVCSRMDGISFMEAAVMVLSLALAAALLAVAVEVEVAIFLL